MVIEVAQERGGVVVQDKTVHHAQRLLRDRLRVVALFCLAIDDRGGLRVVALFSLVIDLALDGRFEGLKAAKNREANVLEVYTPHST